MTKFLSFSLYFLLWACASSDVETTPMPVTPEAVDDQVVTMTNYARTLDGLTDNDKEADQARLELPESSQQGGELSLVNGLVRYTPPVDFVGTDVFSYSLCMSNSCSTAQVEVEVLPVLSITIPQELENYYRFI